MRARTKVTETSKLKNVWSFAALMIVFASCVCAEAGPASDISGVVRRSLEAGERNAERLPGWVSGSRVDERQLDDQGGVKSEEVRTYEYVDIEGVLVRKMIAKNGKPLEGDDARREDQRVAKLARTRKTESAEARAKRLAEREKKKQKEREFSKEIIDAFDFKLLGEENVAGRPAWLLSATPRPGYKPSDMRASIFPHVRGKIWIDQKDYLWSKAEADAFEPISLGFSLIAKLDEGAHLFFEQVRMNDGTWLLQKSGLRAFARVALVKRVAIDQITVYRNFRTVPAGAEVDDTPLK